MSPWNNSTLEMTVNLKTKDNVIDHEARRGKVTASRAAGILTGIYGQTEESVMREMVRDWFGAESEFFVTKDVQRGVNHEADAIEEYALATGNHLDDTPLFVTHPEHDWLGCSPDQFVFDPGYAEETGNKALGYGGAEIKCPRKIPDGPVAGHVDQVRVCMACTGRNWWDIAYYAVDTGELESFMVVRDDAWEQKYIPVLKDFHDRFLAIIADEKLSAPYLEDKPEREVVMDEIATELGIELATVRRKIEALTARENELKTEIQNYLGIVEGTSAKVAGIIIAHVAETPGNVSWQKYAESLGGTKDGSKKFQGKAKAAHYRYTFPKGEA